MTDSEGPKNHHEQRRLNWDAALVSSTNRHVGEAGGRVFASEDEALGEGYLRAYRDTPRDLVFKEIGPQLTVEHGEGNWGATIPRVGPENRPSRTVLDLWTATREGAPVVRRVIPKTGHVLTLLTNKPSDQDIDK